MIRSIKALLVIAVLGTVSLAQTTPAPNQASSAADTNRASAYYNFAMGRLYAELAQAEGSRDDVDKAIQYYKEALKADPKAGAVFDELTDLYLTINRQGDAMSLAQEVLKQDPDNVAAHRMLGRIYAAAIARGPQGQIDDRSLQKALQEYQKVTEKDPKDVESWIMLGKLYGTTNNAPEAEKAYNTALALEPDNEEALTGLAMIYGNMGDTAKAIEKLKAATDKNPNERSLMILAKAYEEQKDYKNAAETLKKAVALAPDNDRLTNSLAEDLLYSDQVDEALKIYQDLSARSPRDPLIPLRMAEIFRNKHQYAKAHEAIDKAKKIDPDGLEPREEEIRLLEAENKLEDAITALKSVLDDTARKIYSKEEAQQRAGWYQELGILNRNAGHYPEALDAFKQMGTVFKDSASMVAVQTIETYRAAKDLASAQREADTALKKFPDDYNVVREHADILSESGKIDSAALELHGLLNGPRDRETLLALAEVYERGKRFEDMGKTLDDAEKLSNSDDDKETVFFMRGAMFERMKKYDSAETSFRKVLSLNPDYAGALNYLGYMLADNNVRLDEAYQLIRKAVDLEPDNGAYLDSLGWVYFRQGKLPEAETWLVKAVDRLSTDPTVHDHLGDVYLKLGKTKEAIAQWTASLKNFKEQAPSEVDQDEVTKVGAKLDAARVRLAQETKR
ncbi:MAG TPA: tetratricopeptide repeat protein [Bryobacteraceae bacterium]|nr:tetratricopeptide repeat protein [Bryobacteraceae bacterium]